MQLKQLLCTVIILCSLFGCGSRSEMDRALEIRNMISQCENCSFDVRITADYGSKQYIFTMSCEVDSIGNLTFSIKEPESIEGICGKISENGGKLTFSDEALAFPLLADGLITPAGAPWLYMKVLKGGYINSYESRAGELHLMFDDSLQQHDLQVEAYFSSDNIPYYGEILWEGRRLITLEVTSFVIK